MNFASILAVEIAKQRRACQIDGKDCYNQNIINHGVNIMAGKNGRKRSKDTKDTGGKDKKK